MILLENQLKKYFQRYIDLDETEIKQFLSLTETKSYRKGKIVLEIGRKCNCQYFILNGLLISYSIRENGEYRAIQISNENSWTGDLNSFSTDQLSNRIIRASENSKLLLLNKKNWESLLNLNCKFEKLFRIVFQNAYIQQTKRLEISMNYDSKTRLEFFIREHAAIMARVQKKIIASYLDMSPETLSRLLKKHFP